jgi:hypothetical protein
MLCGILLLQINGVPAPAPKAQPQQDLRRFVFSRQVPGATGAMPKAQPQQDPWRRIRFPRQREARMEAEAWVAVAPEPANYNN